MVSQISFHNVATNNTYVVELLPSADLIIALDKTGNVVEHGTFENLNATQGYVNSLSVNNTNLTDDNGNNKERELNNAPVLKKFDSEPAAAIDIISDPSRQNGDISVYKYYFDTVGMWWCLLFFATLAAFAFFYVFSSKSKQAHTSNLNIDTNGTVSKAIWLKFWTSNNVNHPNQHLAYYLGIYGTIQALCLLMAAVSGWYVIRSLNTA